MNDPNGIASSCRTENAVAGLRLRFTETPAQTYQRASMIREQLEPRGIRAPRVLAAMGAVPRHLFVDSARQAQAYTDNALPSLEGQTISQPFIVALMTQLLDLAPNHRVLEIGGGTGYQTAVLALLCAQVFSVERIAALGAAAGGRLTELGFDNITLKIDDGSVGWPENQPFDRILVAAGAPEAPAPLLAQLAPAGILLMPVGRAKHQTLTAVTRTPHGFVRKEFVSCRFVPLLGRHGWSAETYANETPKNPNNK